MAMLHKTASLLLLSSALVAPAALAQNSEGDAAPALPAEEAQPVNASAKADAATEAAVASVGQAAQEDQPEQTEQAEAPPPDISIPGGDIVVVGRRNSNIQKAAPAVISVLSTEDIKRTGEGNIAGALGRVTGLSVVGNGFVYVRGLGDRYSLALLNGSPLPSPEPLKRVVPLDIFPTNVVASSLVQKSYSANYPGEFGGGVVNLTTQAVPTESFVTIGGGLAWDSETTNRLGYTYFGSSTDWTGFDNGARDLPPALTAFFASGNRISEGTTDTVALAKQLTGPRISLLQRNRHLPPNWSANITGGTSFDLGWGDLGVIASLGYNNRWRTRDALQQTANAPDVSTVDNDFQRVTTDDRVVVNGLLGVGLEFDSHKIRWTNLFIRDTLKQASLAFGQRNANQSGQDFFQQRTAWFERQLIDTQLVAEFKFGIGSLSLRGSYANSQREAPYELTMEYARTNQGPYGNVFTNNLSGQFANRPTIAFSDLNENLWSAGADVSLNIAPTVTTTFGWAFSDTKRRSDRREFQFVSNPALPAGVDQFRPDLLLAPAIIQYFGIGVIETTEGNPAFSAQLKNLAGYGQLRAELADGLTIEAGARFETAKQTVEPVQLFNVPVGSAAGTRLSRDYWLPAVTLTYEIAPQMQVRLNASKTIARPQFRELIFQSYYDPDSNRNYRGNPLLTDSQLYNAEARYEWYFARDQRVSASVFYKKIKNPIEAFVSSDSNALVTSFANAPEAKLYGAELELQKYFSLASMSEAAFWQSRRLALIANYTYTKSELKVGANDPARVFASNANKATDYFVDGTPLTGQSDHLINLQVGLEDQDNLSQQTLMLSYASERVTSRGLSGFPDVIEKPGFRVDFVARQGIRLGKFEFDAKLEARNLTGQKYEEFQQSGSNIVYANRYKVGRTFSGSLSVKF